jgi:ABC-type branched-subunit amino acid transport system substrate-binding protein
MVSKYRGLVVVFAVLSLVAVGCSSSSKKAATPASSTSTPGASSSTPGAANTASDVGVTPTQITLGNVAVLSGPVPGLFQGSPYAVDAYFNYINSQGGINGRKLVLKSGDDGLTCSLDQTVTQDLSTQVFAFVGSFTVLDSCGAKVFQAHPEIPDVSFSLTPDSKKLSNLYSPQPNPPNFRTGGFQYMKQKFPNAVTAVGSLYTNNVGATESFNEQKAAMESVGYKVVYSRAYAATESQFTSDIIKMRSAGVQFLWLTDTDDATAARVMNEALQQNWHPQVIMSGSQYDANFIKLVDPKAVEGMWADEQFALFQGEDRASVPEVELFQTWMQKTHPGFPPDLFAMYSWAGAALFVQALKAAGPNPTRAGLYDALKNIHNFDDNGMLPVTDVGAKKPPTCYLIAQRQGDKWVRVAPADKGFTCDPGGYNFATS